MQMRVAAAGLVVALAAGCGGGKVSPDGKVVIGDKAYNPEADGDLTVSLSGEGAAGTHTAQVQPDGSFRVQDSAGGGVAPGKYKVGYTRYPSKDEMAKLKGPPAPKTVETGEVWDVAAGKSFTLDLAKSK